MSNIISKIQFTIYSLFAFIISLSIIVYASLIYGISLPLVILPQFKAEQLYIKLDKKLIFEAKRIEVTIRNKDKYEVPLLKTPAITPFLDFARKNFSKIKIDELYIGKNIVAFSYNSNSKEVLENSISYKGNGIDGLITFDIHDKYAYLKIDNLFHEKTNILIEGEGVYEFHNQKAFTKLKLTLPSCADINLYIKNNDDIIAFVAKSNLITNIKPIVDLFELKPSITKWILEYNKASSYEILQASGLYDYNNIDLILETLYIQAKEKIVIGG